MSAASREDAASVFDPLRPSLVRVAYRMLGSVADAEDVVQDAFLAGSMPTATPCVSRQRFCAASSRACAWIGSNPPSASARPILGTWLPEPVVEASEDEMDDVTLPLLMALERLSPLERAAFLLHDVFGLGFDEVAATIERDPAACRQLAARARAHIRADRPRYPVPKETGIEIAEAFFAASRDGEMDRLRALLATDVTVYADGGGKATAHGAPVAGLDDVMRLFEHFAPSLPRIRRASCAMA